MGLSLRGFKVGGIRWEHIKDSYFTPQQTELKEALGESPSKMPPPSTDLVLKDRAPDRITWRARHFAPVAPKTLRVFIDEPMVPEFDDFDLHVEPKEFRENSEPERVPSSKRYATRHFAQEGFFPFVEMVRRDEQNWMFIYAPKNIARRMAKQLEQTLNCRIEPVVWNLRMLDAVYDSISNVWAKPSLDSSKTTAEYDVSVDVEDYKGKVLTSIQVIPDVAVGISRFTFAREGGVSTMDGHVTREILKDQFWLAQEFAASSADPM